jgi:predicted dehydrogenase
VVGVSRPPETSTYAAPEPLNVGMVGCGTISTQYLTTIAALPMLRLVAVADLEPERARTVTDAYTGVRALSVDQLMSSRDVEVVLNLTIPAAHAGVALQAIAAGKDVYGEKPLAATTTEARAVLEAAAQAGVRVGCAPDTVLGTGIQTARKAVDDGLLGSPISATALLMTPGPESWHPNPDFYYAAGGGPLLDMGPYYITSLVSLLGPVTSVIGAASHLRQVRTIGSGPRRAERVPVSVDTHVSGVLVHASGALSTLVMSFDAPATRASPIEVHGERASLVVPDPNRFDGEVLVRGAGEPAWRTLPPSAGYQAARRGYGLAEMATLGRHAAPRASGTLAFHVLDIMESLLDSAASGQARPVSSTCARPAPVPLTASLDTPAA